MFRAKPNEEYFLCSVDELFDTLCSLFRLTTGNLCYVCRSTFYALIIFLLCGRLVLTSHSTGSSFGETH